MAHRNLLQWELILTLTVTILRQTKALENMQLILHVSIALHIFYPKVTYFDGGTNFVQYRQHFMGLHHVVIFQSQEVQFFGASSLYVKISRYW